MLHTKTADVPHEASAIKDIGKPAEDVRLEWRKYGTKVIQIPMKKKSPDVNTLT